MRIVLAIAIVAGCALLTVARIPAFSSNASLWASALPSNAPRVSVNAAAALLEHGQWELAGQMSLKALRLAERPESAYEREAVRAIVRRQVQYLDTWYPVCARQDFSPLC